MSAPPRRFARWIATPLVAIVVGCAARSGVSQLEPAGGTAPASTQTTSAATGRPLLSRRCGGCHAIPQPAEMSGREWLDGLEKMRRRMRLPEAEWDSLAAMAVGDTAAPAGR